MERVRALGGLALVVWTALKSIPYMDTLDDEHLVLQHHHTLGLRAQFALARIDPARLQRAAQGPSESTGGGGDHVVERRGVVRILTGGRPVVLADLVVGAEEHRLGFGWNVGPAYGPAIADDPYL